MAQKVSHKALPWASDEVRKAQGFGAITTFFMPPPPKPKAGRPPAPELPPKKRGRPPQSEGDETEQPATPLTATLAAPSTAPVFGKKAAAQLVGVKLERINWGVGEDLERMTKAVDDWDAKSGPFLENYKSMSLRDYAAAVNIPHQTLARYTCKDVGKRQKLSSSAKLELVKDKVTVLSDALELTDTIKFDGHMLCEDLVRKQHEHDVQCGKGGTCRLTLRLRPAAVIAAALLKEAMRKNGIDRLFEELKKVLKGDDVDAADTGKVGKTHAIVRDLLKGAPYPCADEDSGRAAAAAAAQAESLRLGASGSSEGSAAGAAGRGADGSIAAAPHPAIALVPRLTTQLRLPYYLERRAVECIEDWSLFGLPALMPQTISALALLRAFEELVQPKLRNGKQNRPLPQLLPQLSVADIAQEAGLTEKTLTQHMRHEDLPWPTLLLQDLAHRLAPPPPFAFRTEAQKILDRILQVPGNPAAEATREWSRKLTPRLVAACALLLGARKAAADEAAAATATATTPTEPPDTAAVAAAAGVSPQALDAALAAYPPAQVTM